MGFHRRKAQEKGNDDTLTHIVSTNGSIVLLSHSDAAVVLSSVFIRKFKQLKNKIDF